MAKRKKQDGAIPATDATSGPVPVVPETVTQSPAAVAEQAGTEQTQPVPRRFRVQLPACRCLEVTAESPEEAFERYKALMGITDTVHKPDITEA